MRILLLTERLHLGGAETSAVALAGALARLPGREVSFAAADGELRARLDPAVAFRPLPVYSPLGAPGLVRALSRLLREGRYDVVHAHGATVGILAALAAGLAGVRPAFVLTHHSAATRRAPGALARRLMDLAFDRVIAISREKRESLVAGGFPADKLASIPNFVDCAEIERRVAAVDREAVRAELGLRPGSKAVAIAGRLIPGKRVDRFIEILARRPGGPVGLVLGDGPERARLEALAKSRPDARVVFLGYRPDVFRYLAVADAFLFPTDAEVLPMALIEAQAAGVPAVCSDIPGNAEIVADGRTGFLVRGDDGEFRARLDELLARPGMGPAARAAARANFDEPAVAARVAALYDSLGGGRA